MIFKPLLLDSITDANADSKGRVIVCGSHGGMYPAALASHAGLRAVLFNDAGIGCEKAGVAGVLALANAGMAAAAVECVSCHIGSAQDTLENGIISVVNSVAKALGVKAGMSVIAAVDLLAKADDPLGDLPLVAEARKTIVVCGTKIHLLDSASLVQASDRGKIVITGSHGGLIGGNPARALKALAKIAVFNDAGFGKDSIGISRLPALEARGVAAVTVDCSTARIGDATSALETGVVSAHNDLAFGMGAQVGVSLLAWLSDLKTYK